MRWATNSKRARALRHGPRMLFGDRCWSALRDHFAFFFEVGAGGAAGGDAGVVGAGSLELAGVRVGGPDETILRHDAEADGAFRHAGGGAAVEPAGGGNRILEGARAVQVIDAGLLHAGAETIHGCLEEVGESL